MERDIDRGTRVHKRINFEAEYANNSNQEYERKSKFNPAFHNCINRPVSNANDLQFTLNP